jgi:protein-S-isoprenylcysteine O-methyltransferase Ste14
MNRPTPSPRSRQLVIAVIVVLLGWLIISYGHRYHLVFTLYLPLEIFAIILIACGVLVRVMAAREIRSTYHIERLVTSGIYSRTRNPVYLAFGLIIAGIAILSFSYLSFVWVFISFLLIFWVARREEKDLEKTFGDSYLKYKSEVPAFFPRLIRRKEIIR